MKKLKICYHTNEVNYRGLFRSVIDYVKYNKKLYGHEGIIVAPDARSIDSQHHPLGVELCRKNEIKLFQYQSGTDRGKEPLGFFPNVDKIIRNENCDLLYIVKGGDVPDDRFSRIVPTLQHGWRGVPWDYTNVNDRLRGMHDASCWGTPSIPVVSAAMSKLASIRGGATTAYVPTIVEPNTVKYNLRKELNIPADAIVFGNLGGEQVFNMLQPQRIIERIIKEKQNFYFIFMGIKALKWKIANPFVKFLPPTVDDERRYAFINSCDAMIHGRKQGEMGGGAVAEFSISNKPVFTSCTGKAGARMMLKEKGFVYNTDDDLYNWMINFDRVEMAKKNWDCYSSERFPEPAMKLFHEIFLKRFV